METTLLRKYHIILQHDEGTWSIIVPALNKEAAEKIVCQAESCPKSSILMVNEYPA
jgi:hypothetical protein